MKNRLLIIGATGLVGKAVAQRAAQESYEVRILTRGTSKANDIFDNQIEIMEGDVFDPSSMEKAFIDVKFVFVSLPEKAIPEGMRNIIQISKNAGIQRIAYISGSSVRIENAVHPMIISHLEGEKLLVESGIPWSIFRPTMILDTLPRYANNGKPFIIGDQPHKWSWIHTDDIARMVCDSFSKVEAENKKFTLFGPDSLTFNEAVDVFNAEFHPGAKKSKSTPLWMAKLMSVFIGKKLKYAVSIFQYFTCHPQEGNPDEANRILGKPIVGTEKFIEMYRNTLDGKNT